MNNTTARIRLASTDDLLDIQFCAREAYAKYVERMDREPAPMVADFEQKLKSGHVYVAVFESSVAGFVVFYPEEKHMHLENVAVLPSYAGRGIGKKLTEFVEHAARAKSLNAVELYTNEAMTENLSMYPKLGYIETERKEQAGFRRVFFRKSV